MNRFWEFDDYRLDVDRRLLFRREAPVPLPSKAFDILLVLVQRHGEVVSKDELIEAVWPNSFVEEANLTQNVHLLRKALGEKAQENRYIVTLAGRGYSFVADVKPRGDENSEENLRQTTHHWIGSFLTSARSRSRTKALLLATVLGVSAVCLTGLGLPTLARHYNDRGVALQKDARTLEAIESFRRAIMLRSNYAAAHYNLADTYERLPAYDKALEEYQKAIESDPLFYESYNNLARLYIKRRNDYSAALELLDHEANLSPRELSVRYSLLKNYGWADFELHHSDQAEISLRKAIELDSYRGAAHCLLGMVLDAESKRRAADTEWEECLRYSNQEEVEPEWRVIAQERQDKEGQE
jgi:DNA-binding winged helix-turn-helix (wHTH) protein/Flp pilus assembly protein TadD